MQKSRVLYLESVTADSKFTERTQWRSKLPSLPKWPFRRKSNKKRPRTADGDESEPKRRCSTRNKVAEIFTSGATAVLIRDSFPNQKGVVVSETASMPEDLLNISLGRSSSLRSGSLKLSFLAFCLWTILLRIRS